MSVTLPIYLDNHATTRTDPRVFEAMRPLFEDDYGNAASHTHVFGWRAEAALEAAREDLAAALGGRRSSEVIFTSGATESNNLAIKGVFGARPRDRDEIVTVATEHPSVLDPCAFLARRGARVTVLPVDAEGLVDPGDLRAALTPRTLLVSIMTANNEIGVLQPIAELGAICRDRGVLLHTDAAQAVGKIPIDVAQLNVDLMSISAHKVYGPKGAGALWIRSGRPRVRVEPLQHGGGHERGLRSGTVAVPLMVGLAKAVEIAVAELETEASRVGGLRDRLCERICKEVDGVVRNGHATQRLPGNLSLSFEGVDGDSLLLALKDVAVSSGSACSSATPEPSHVLTALGLPPALVRGSLRFGIGRFNREEEIDWVAETVVSVVRDLRARTFGRATISARNADPTRLPSPPSNRDARPEE